jgi:hypothetical protein
MYPIFDIEIISSLFRIREKQGLKIIMGHNDIITKLLMNVITEQVIVIDILRIRE